MKESPKVKFPEFEFQSKASLKKCKSLNAELGEISGHREDHKQRANAIPTADGSSFEQAFVRSDAKGQFIDTHLEERNLLESTGDLVESLIDEAVKLVKDCENNSEVAFQRIRAEIDKYELPFTNDRQLTFFVRNSGEVRLFDNKVTAARQFETASRRLVGEIRERCNWLTDFVISERSKLTPVG